MDSHDISSITHPFALLIGKLESMAISIITLLDLEKDHEARIMVNDVIE